MATRARARRGERRSICSTTSSPTCTRSSTSTRLRPLKVVADTANGMGGLVVPRVFEKLPVDLEVLFPELDGTFPNHPADPDPAGEPARPAGAGRRARRRRRPRVRRRRRPRVPRRRAGPGAVGLDDDGDARHAACSPRSPGAKIIHNLICSKAVPEVVREHGGEPVRTRVGHSFIKQVMAETGAAFGGEHSAHYYFRDNYRADSGIIATMFVLERDVAVGACRCPSCASRFERYADSGEINTEVADPHATIERVAAALRRVRSRTASTASPSTSATGGSTCARRTPSRCCA